jgi:predicted ATPase/adenylate cyclase class IV
MMKYIVTGGPCTGKTTLLRKIEEAGYKTVPESARQIIKEEEERARQNPGYVPVIPQNDLQAFERKVVERQLCLESKIEGTAFLDRSIADAVAYAKRGAADLGDRVHDHIKDAGYTRVFILDQLPVYEQDSERKETPEEAAEIHEKICNTYERLGFDIVRVPAVGPDKRLELVLREIGTSTKEIEGKYRVDDLEQVREALSAYDVDHIGKVKEENKMHDVLGFLDRFGYSLRTRSNGKYLLTLKGKNTGREVNERSEPEIELPKPVFYALRKLLPVSGSYTKTRDLYVPVGDQSCSICLDYLPGKGNFVEIEAGTKNQVMLWKQRLGIKGECIRQPYYRIGDAHPN